MSSPKRACYTRNGTQITDIAYEPCTSDLTRDSACCGLNHQGAGHIRVANDVCDPNGLCQNFEAYDGTNQGVKNWWRQGCTDPTWQSKSCLQNVCNDAKWDVNNAPVQKCADGSWCCGAKSCCNTSSSLFQLAPTLSTSAVASTVSMAVTGGSLGPTASASPAASPAGAPSGSGLSVGAKAGIGSGIALVVVLLVVIALLAMKLRKRRKGVEKDANNVNMAVPMEQGERYMNPYVNEPAPVEMLAESAPVEVVGTRLVAELPGSHSPQIKSPS